MSTATCVNLLQVFGRDYKVTFDPAYDSRRVRRRRVTRGAELARRLLEANASRRQALPAR
jgi:hypothetical protein